MLVTRRLVVYRYSIVLLITVCWGRDTVIYCMHGLVIGRRGLGPVTGLLRHHPPWRAQTLRA